MKPQSPPPNETPRLPRQPSKEAVEMAARALALMAMRVHTDAERRSAENTSPDRKAVERDVGHVKS